MQRSDPEDFQLRWQAFLIDGFDDWLPAATIAASNTTNQSARDVLRGMISAFYFPMGIEQSTEEITSRVEGLAYAMNAIVRDPKTGEILGRMKDLQAAKRPKAVYQPREDPVRKLKRERRAAREAAKSKEA